MQMPWHILKVERLWQKRRQVVPSADFKLTNGTITRSVRGWLPCHHSNVAYELQLGSSGAIKHVLSMAKGKKKKETALKKMAKTLGQWSHYPPEKYIEQANFAYNNFLALELVGCLYPLPSVFEMTGETIQRIFSVLVQDMTQLCCRDSDICIPALCLNEREALRVVNLGLSILCELPLRGTQLNSFLSMVVWQKLSRYNTAVYKKPETSFAESLDGVHREKFIEWQKQARGGFQLQKYQGLWTSSNEIAKARGISRYITPENCTLHLGSICPSILPVGAVVLVRDLEDAYRLQCKVELSLVQTCMLKVRSDEASVEHRNSLGVPRIVPLQAHCPTVYVAWAHLWSIEDWIGLIALRPQYIVCIGRLDQYSCNRGHVFRDMCEKSMFTRTLGFHWLVDHVEQVECTNETINALVEKVREQFHVVQCFADNPKTWKGIDTGRRWLFNPWRIRTIAVRKCIRTPRIALYEEHFTSRTCSNASVVKCCQYTGLPVPAAIYLCGPSTTAFDVQVARSHTSHKLFVVNARTCLVPFVKNVIKKSIDPFI